MIGAARAALAFGVALCLAAPGTAQQVPQSYGAGYGELVAAAYKERSLSVDSTTDEDEAAGLLAGFQALYPGLQVTYAKRGSTELYDRFLKEAAAGATVDLLWSSAMDLQVKLVNDGYAQAYASPERASLPDWAVWSELAYGVTAEPVGIAYDKRRLAGADVPRTHADLERLLARPDAPGGKVAAYDPERSGAGYLFLTQDVEVTDRTWELVRAMGRAGAGSTPRPPPCSTGWSRARRPSPTTCSQLMRPSAPRRTRRSGSSCRPTTPSWCRASRSSPSRRGTRTRRVSSSTT